RVALIVLVVLVILGVLGPLNHILGDPNALSVAPPLSGTASGYLLGTDNLGRSLLPRVVEGIRQTFLLATMAVLISTAIGVLVGMGAAYLRGLVDEFITRVADVLFSFPAILLAILISAILHPGTPTAVAAVVLVTLPLMVRIVRAAALTVVEQDFVMV